MKILFTFLTIIISLQASAKVVDQVTARLGGLYRSACKAAEADIRGKIETHVSAEDFSVTSLWAPGNWSSSGSGNWIDSSPPRYHEPICEVTVTSKSAQWGLEKNYSGEFTGPDRMQQCDAMVENLEATSGAIMVKVITGGIFKRYCQVSYVSIVGVLGQ